MITINPVKFNSTKKYVSFGDGSNMNNTTLYVVYRNEVNAINDT